MHFNVVVSSWNGESSQIDREAERERQMQKKRSHDQMYDEDLDRGKVSFPDNIVVD